MPRRISLALALAFTTVVTFAIVAIGARAGVFSDGHASNSTASAEEAEIEFVGAVTAVSGNQVIFNHGGTLTTVQVSNPGALAVGVTAHVHALLTSSGYVATEVSIGG